jgi:seryl-tRNA synthetase
MKLKNYWNQINQLLKSLKPQVINEVVNHSNLQIKISELEAELRSSNEINTALTKQVDSLTKKIVDVNSKFKNIKTLEVKIQNRDECYIALLDWTMNNLGKEVTFDVNVMKNYWIDQIK